MSALAGGRIAIFKPMCGRYQIEKNGTLFWRFFRGGRGVTGRWVEQSITPGSGSDHDPLIDPPIPLPTWLPMREVKPTQKIPIFRLDPAGRVELRMVTWWLCPPWARDRVKWYINMEGKKSFRWLPGKPPGTHFNTRFDTLTKDKRSYWWNLLEGQRCVLPVDGFIEWPDDELRDKTQPKIPRLFSLKGGAPFFFPGLWEEVLDDEGHPFLSANLITVGPNEMLQSLPHRRMPAMLKTPKEVEEYLGAPTGEAAAKALQTTPAEMMEMGPWPLVRGVSVGGLLEG